VKWRKVNEKCLESEDGKWSITRNDIAGKLVYQLTRLGKRKGSDQKVSYEGSESVLIAASADECKAVACEGR
jgi:hypothetical protein